MKIVIDARESGTSTGRYVDKLIEYLQRIDTYNTYVLLLKKNRLSAYQNIEPNFQVVECNVKEFTFAEQTRLLRVIRKLKPDLVHFPLVQHPVLYFGKCVIGMLDLTTLRFRNPSKNPIIFWLKQKIYWFVNYVATKKAAKIITISEFVKNDIVEHFKIDPSKIVVTHNSADFIADKPIAYEPLIDKQFIMYVGRHQPHKNLDRLIEAHHKLLKVHPKLILAIVGKKDKTTAILQENVESANYKNVVFTDFVSDAQLRWLYEHTACYVFPSLSEGFGLPGLEAMVHGAPVASSNATSLPEVYGDAAHYFDPLDDNDIAQKISEIIDNKSLRQELFTKGKKQASEFSWRRMAEQTLEVYEKCA
ncbi:glycosyltransferase family 4 protein [Candidatus Saccharibacteria bacterium]|nr:glycosyltransferase family 4 protein [Candidatus Saccharibacteria bacterium]